MILLFRYSLFFYDLYIIHTKNTWDTLNFPVYGFQDQLTFHVDIKFDSRHYFIALNANNLVDRSFQYFDVLFVNNT